MSLLGWDSISAPYARHITSLTFLHALDLLSSLPLHAPCTILDIACGSGALSLAYLTLYPEGHPGHTMLLTDYSGSMVEQARRTVHSRKPACCKTDFKFLVADATTLEGVADASVDIVMSTFGIALIHPPEGVLGQVARVLKPRGTLALSAWCDLPEASKEALLADKRAFDFNDIMRKACMALVPQHSPIMKMPMPWKIWSDASVASSFLAANAFQNVTVQHAVHTKPLPSFNVLWQLITTANAFVDIQQVDNEVVSCARQALKARMQVEDDDGELITLLTSSHILVCTKQS